MGRRMEQITAALKSHDYKLYCGENKEGTLCVFRKSYTCEVYQIGDNILNYLRPAPHFIFAITDNWKANGIPRDWGIDPIMTRILSIDSWNRDVAGELVKQYEKDDASKDRDVDNNIEAFAKDYRRTFAKETNHINTANMKKIDKRRLKDGNH